jgi:hypothetical protein
MRKIHRWLSVIFAVLLLWIASTGLMSHAAALVRDAEPKVEVAAPAGFVCPDSMTCRPKPNPNGAGPWVSYLHHLHAGEEFGAVGTTLSIASGFALLFFAFSGLYMYIQMYRRRSHRKRHPRTLFW